MKTRADRTAIERTLLAPYGSISLIDAKDLQVLAQRIVRGQSSPCEQMKCCRQRDKSKEN
ncbi:MAG: hypothetical protein V8Q79_07025 [Christensenellales bacterium]